MAPWGLRCCTACRGIVVSTCVFVHEVMGWAKWVDSCAHTSKLKGAKVAVDSGPEAPKEAADVGAE